MISLQELRDATRVRGTSQDGYLVDLEEAAVDYAERATNLYLGPEATRTERHHGTGTPLLYLEAAPPSADDVTLDEFTEVGGTANPIAAADSDGFELWDTRTLARKAGGVWARDNIYVATFTAGYKPGREPELARRLVTSLVVWWFERRTPAPRIGEVHSFPVPHHISAMIGKLKRHLV